MLKQQGQVPFAIKDCSHLLHTHLPSYSVDALLQHGLLLTSASQNMDLGEEHMIPTNIKQHMVNGCCGKQCDKL